MTTDTTGALAPVADIETLKALRERLRKANGPDREIDADLMAACFGWAKRGSPYLAPHCEGEEPIYWHAPEPFYKRPVPRLSASLDAALALVERLLRFSEDSSWSWRIGNTLSYGYFAQLGANGKDEFGPTPALALLAALLSALIAEKEAGNG